MPHFRGAWPGGHDDPHHQPPNTTRGVNDEGVESLACPEYTAAATASQAKYQAAWEMEARVAEKEAELLQLHERIAEEQQNRSGGSGEKETEKGASKVQAEAEAVEREIEELAREMERLRTEADEEFAKELAEEEERRVRG
jgi:predicted  nucleic acid-binding Zn-ribbon protein